MHLLAASPFSDEFTRWGAIGVAAITLFLLIVKPTMRKKDPLAKTPKYANLASQRAVERQMSELLVELSEMARQITAQLDTRAAKLELLLHDADERIGQLQALRDGEVSPPVMAAAQQLLSRPIEETTMLPAPAVPEAAPTEVLDPRHVEIYRLADEGQGVHDIAQQLGRPRGEVELILALRPRQ